MSTNSSTGSSSQGRTHRIYLRILGCCLFGCLALLAIFNLLVNPLGAYPSIGLTSLEHYRGHFATRAAKAEALAHGHYDIILLGTSRVEMGVPVTHPAFGSARVYDVGLVGTSLPELVDVLDFAIRHNHLKRVVFGVDFLLFSDRRAPRADFDTSRFNPNLNTFEYHARNLFDWDATVRSWSLIDRVLHHRPPPAGERGFIPRAIPAGMSQRAVFGNRIRGFLVDPETYGAYHYSQERLERFREIIRLCLSNDIDLTLFIPPVHALDLETVRVAGLWPIFEQWKRDATRIVAEETRDRPIPLWDFTGFKGPVAEPVPSPGDRTTRMKWYIETSHFTPALGALVLNRLFNLPGQSDDDSFGTPLTPANIEDHLTQLRDDREKYAAAYPDEIAWVEQIALHKDENRRRKAATAED